jgi:hypothetical protein
MSTDPLLGRCVSGTDQYEVIEVIGKGSFGVVSKIRRKEDGKVRAGSRTTSCAKSYTIKFMRTLLCLPCAAVCLERIELWSYEREGEAARCIRGQ